MDFESLDAYLLDGKLAKADVVRELLERRPLAHAAGAYYEGLERLGERTPDLALIALRLTLAGATADDAAVVKLREILKRARNGDAGARVEYYALVRTGVQ